MTDRYHEPLLVMLLAGVLTGLGQLLASDERMSPRVVLGRAITSGSLGLSFGLAMNWLPTDVSTPVLVGGACTVASLGTSGLERLIQRITGGR